MEPTRTRPASRRQRFAGQTGDRGPVAKLPGEQPSPPLSHGLPSLAGPTRSQRVRWAVCSASSPAARSARSAPATSFDRAVPLKINSHSPGCLEVGRAASLPGTGRRQADLERRIPPRKVGARCAGHWPAVSSSFRRHPTLRLHQKWTHSTRWKSFLPARNCFFFVVFEKIVCQHHLQVLPDGRLCSMRSVAVANLPSCGYFGGVALAAEAARRTRCTGNPTVRPTGQSAVDFGGGLSFGASTTSGRPVGVLWKETGHREP